MEEVVYTVVDEAVSDMPRKKAVDRNAPQPEPRKSSRNKEKPAPVYYHGPEHPNKRGPGKKKLTKQQLAAKEAAKLEKEAAKEAAKREKEAAKEAAKREKLAAKEAAKREKEQAKMKGVAGKGAPKKAAAPKETATPKKVATPKGSATGKKATTPKETAAPKKAVAPKETAAPKKVAAPKAKTVITNVATPKGSATGKKATTPRKTAAPKKAAAPTVTTVIKKVAQKAVAEEEEEEEEEEGPGEEEEEDEEFEGGEEEEEPEEEYEEDEVEEEGEGENEVEGEGEDEDEDEGEDKENENAGKIEPPSPTPSPGRRTSKTYGGRWLSSILPRISEERSMRWPSPPPAADAPEVVVTGDEGDDASPAIGTASTPPAAAPPVTPPNANMNTELVTPRTPVRGATAAGAPPLPGGGSSGSSSGSSLPPLPGGDSPRRHATPDTPTPLPGRDRVAGQRRPLPPAFSPTGPGPRKRARFEDTTSGKHDEHWPPIKPFTRADLERAMKKVRDMSSGADKKPAMLDYMTMKQEDPPYISNRDTEKRYAAQRHQYLDSISDGFNGKLRNYVIPSAKEGMSRIVTKDEAERYLAEQDARGLAVPMAEVQGDEFEWNYSQVPLYETSLRSENEAPEQSRSNGLRGRKRKLPSAIEIPRVISSYIVSNDNGDDQETHVRKRARIMDSVATATSPTPRGSVAPAAGPLTVTSPVLSSRTLSSASESVDTAVWAPIVTTPAKSAVSSSRTLRSSLASATRPRANAHRPVLVPIPRPARSAIRSSRPKTPLRSAGIPGSTPRYGTTETVFVPMASAPMTTRSVRFQPSPPPPPPRSASSNVTAVSSSPPQSGGSSLYSLFGSSPDTAPDSGTGQLVYFQGSPLKSPSGNPVAVANSPLYPSSLGPAQPPSASRNSLTGSKTSASSPEVARSAGLGSEIRDSFSGRSLAPSLPRIARAAGMPPHPNSARAMTYRYRFSNPTAPRPGTSRSLPLASPAAPRSATTNGVGVGAVSWPGTARSLEFRTHTPLGSSPDGVSGVWGASSPASAGNKPELDYKHEDKDDEEEDDDGDVAMDDWQPQATSESQRRKWMGGGVLETAFGGLFSEWNV